MTQVSIEKWGKSQVIRLPESITEYLDFNVNDVLNVEIKDDAIILSKPKNEITVEELFKDYKGGSFQAKLQGFESIGNEKW